MPRYDYKCENKKCTIDAYFEILPIKDYRKKTRCPECNKIGKKQLGCNIDKLAASKWNV